MTPKNPKKAPRKRKSPSKRAPKPKKGLLDLALETFQGGLKALDSCIEKVATQISEDEELDTKLSSHLAWLLTQQKSVITELRQLEKHERFLLDSITPEERYENVLTYIEHEMPAAKRADMAALLDRLQREEKLLG